MQSEQLTYYDVGYELKFSTKKNENLNRFNLKGIQVNSNRISARRVLESSNYDKIVVQIIKIIELISKLFFTFILRANLFFITYSH